MANKSRLQLWQDRLLKNENACQSALDAMDARQEIYLGSSRLISRVKGDRKTKAAHVRNLTAELIEAQVNSSIPQPKVTAKRKEDEGKARLIEDMLRNELDRLPFEQLNDMMERTVPIQGGACFLVEWDNRKRTHTTVGELAVTAVHPKQLIPQEGVTTGIQDMDYVILKLPQTKESLRKRYGVTLEELEQEEEDGKGTDTVTQYTAYYKNDSGGIGLYSWVNDTELEDLPDYQARRIKRCKDCGAPKPEGGEKQPCPKCGCKEWEDSEEEFEELWDPIARSDGSTIPGVFAQEQEDGLGGVVTTAGPTRIPYYKPDIFPVILQKNVSVYGQLLGDSDVDKIADQQNTANRIETKIIEKLIKSGSYLVLPDDASLRADAEDMKVIRPGTPAAAQMISVKDMEGNISKDMAYLAQVYEEARQVIGITDSFQGRRDTTATSGRAKEFSANQAAGRLESKRVMKDAAYAQLFEAMFIQAGLCGRKAPGDFPGYGRQSPVRGIQPLRFSGAGRRRGMVLERWLSVFLRYHRPSGEQPGGHVAGNQAEPAKRGLRQPRGAEHAASVLGEDGAAALSRRGGNQAVSGTQTGGGGSAGASPAGPASANGPDGGNGPNSGNAAAGTGAAGASSGSGGKWNAGHVRRRKTGRRVP